MNMVILRGKQLRIFYENDGNFFSRGRVDLKIGAFERKMFEVFQKIFFLDFGVFLEAVPPFLVRFTAKIMSNSILAVNAS